MFRREPGPTWDNVPASQARSDGLWDVPPKTPHRQEQRPRSSHL